jgi:hypothetical protein
MKKIISAFFIIGFSISLFAQAEIKFSENTHDFGAVEEGELATYIFKFKNTGNDTLQLKSVKPSCGCTSPYWAKDPVLPGETGEIKVQYNSKKRPGPFNKSINIVSNATEPSHRLKIKGVVLNGPDTTITKDSISKSAAIQLTNTVYILGEIEKNQREIIKVMIVNNGTSTLKITKVRAGCGCMYTKEADFSVAPGQSKELPIIFSSNDTGLIDAAGIIETNDPVRPYVSINIKATVKESLRQENLMQTNPGSGF